jgi:hypothetical protein
MSSNIIELRQVTADQVNDNGDYLVTLPNNKQLLLEENDSLIVKQVFIDTEAQSSLKINVKSQMILNIEFIKYYILSRQDNLVQADGNALIGDPTDCELYILCDNVGGDPNFTEITQLQTVSTIGEVRGNVVVNYTDTAGNEVNKTVPLNDDGFPIVYTNVQIIYDNRQPVTFTDNQYQVTTINKEAVVGTEHMQPIYDNITVTLESGNYSADQLVEIMNSQLSVGGVSGEVNNYADNPVFTAYVNKFLSLWDGTKIYKINTALMMGASQIEFSYIESTNQFAINYAHTPYYAGGNQAQSVPYQPSVGFLNANAAGYTINKNGGILFTSLTSYYVSNPANEINFWTNVLGFGSSLNPVITGNVDFNFGGLTGKTFKLETEPMDQVETTGGYIGLDDLLDKLNDNWFAPVDVTTGSLLSTTTTTFNIVGSQNTINNLNYGFFLVEIDSTFRNQFYSKDNNLNISSIVSRYYELNSYTSASSDSSLVYIHNSKIPINLTSFRVRILTPSKILAENLGTGTCVYLQLNKAPKMIK